MAVAFVDLDRTLLSVNSGTLWVKREMRDGHLGLVDGLRALAWITRYGLGWVTADDAVRAAVASLAGTPRAPLEARTDVFFHEEVLPRVRPGARAALGAYAARGERVVLLTSSSNYLAARTAAALGLDGFLCTTLEVDAEDRHTGRIVGAPCFGVGKITHAEAWCAAHGERLADASFYTDSFSDLPVLERVAAPRIVDPDRRLARVARRRGWPVVDWDAPGK